MARFPLLEGFWSINSFVQNGKMWHLRLYRQFLGIMRALRFAVFISHGGVRVGINGPTADVAGSTSKY